MFRPNHTAGYQSDIKQAFCIPYIRSCHHLYTLYLFRVSLRAPISSAAFESGTHKLRVSISF